MFVAKLMEVGEALVTAITPAVVNFDIADVIGISLGKVISTLQKASTGKSTAKNTLPIDYSPTSVIASSRPIVAPERLAHSVMVIVRGEAKLRVESIYPSLLSVVLM